MKTSKYFLLVSLTLSIGFTASQAGNKKTPKYRNSDIPINQRVEDLLKRMTLEEKIAQLQSTMIDLEKNNVAPNGIGGIGPILRRYSAKEAAEKANRLQKILVEKTRLGIPAIFHDETLHGLLGGDAVSYPQSIALAASWNPPLVQDVSKAIAKETRTRGIHQSLAPVINIARDARWGRVEETYGEDPFLTSRMGAAYCKGLEGENVIATPKHFAANVGDGGRDSYPIHFSERLLREIYFPAFKACFQEAGARSVMAAYNAIDGTPCSANTWLLTDVLRKEWKFNGFVVSDYGSVAGIKNKHFVAATDEEVGAVAISAGLDMELPSIEFFGAPLLAAAKKGVVSAKAIDNAVRNILRVKFQLGLFEHPYVDPEKAQHESNKPEYRELAVRAAREGIVLLKNENILPLRKDLKTIAVIGALADSVALGGYSGDGRNLTSLLKGIRNKLGARTEVRYARGCDIGNSVLLPIPYEYLRPVDAKPGEQGLQGEYFDNMDFSGAPVFTRIDKQINFEWKMGSPDPKIPVDHFSIRWAGKLIAPISGVVRIGASTDDGVRLFINGKKVIDSWFIRPVSTDIVTLTLEAGKEYDIVMEYYENEGWTYAGLGWDINNGAERQFTEAIETARGTDVAIVAAGIIEGEGQDRSSLELPGEQVRLINALAQTGTPIVIVLINGSAITMSTWLDRTRAVVEAWYGGQEQGTAMADVLFGDYTPGGKLPITFPYSVGQTPLYYNHKPTGRNDSYIDNNGKPLFPFGYGLSYTTFEYSNLRLSSANIPIDGKTEVCVDITNRGNYEGAEVVQLYLHDVVGSVTRPVKELKGFSKIFLKPREMKTVSFTVGREQLEFLDRHLKPIVEPGIVEIMIGSSSEDIRCSANIEIMKK
jgi:beta-glucosidase